MAVLATKRTREGNYLKLARKSCAEVSKNRIFSSFEFPFSSSSILFYANRREFLRSRFFTSSSPPSAFKRKKKHINSRVSIELFQRLNEEEKAQVKNAFHGINRMKVLVSHENSNLDITGRTIQCLMPTGWLNDEVVNLYLLLLKEREARDPTKYLKCHFFNSFFYTTLVGESGSNYVYKDVRRWTTNRKLGYDPIDCHMIFVPIHDDIHWTLAVINIKERKFMYLDSLTTADPTKILNALAKYFVDEIKDKNGKDIDVSSWDKVPVQKTFLGNTTCTYDGGMFMLKYIDFYSRGLNLDFCQDDMQYFRLRTAKEILRQRAD